MASRNFAPVRAITREMVFIEGSFAPNGSSAVSATSRQGLGWSVARTSAGLFTVTLTDKFAALVRGLVSLQLTTGDDKIVQIGAVDLSAKTIQIRVWDISNAAVADIAADAGNRINFSFVLQNSSMLPVRGA